VLYLSTYLGRPVLDAVSRPVGKVLDLLTRLGGPFPLIWGIRVGTGRRTHLDVPWIDVRSFETSQIILSREVADLRPYSLTDRDVLLARNVLDKQIVDLEGRRLIRVQDIQLARTGTRLRVLGVDVSTSALLRRLRFAKLADRIARNRPPHSVAWSDVDLGSWYDPNVRLRVSREGIERLHPADLAEIASDLPSAEGIELLTILDDEVAADTLEEMDPEDQVRFLQALGPERAARMLERMSPDDAADLVQELDREDAEMLLAEMDEQEAVDIRRLLVYEEESAGGLMTTEFLTVEPWETALKVAEHLREHTTEEEHAYHLFVTDEEGKLVGQVTLWELVTADLHATIGSFMDDDPVSVKVDADKGQVVEAIMKYNLLAVPVIDADERLLGVVTIDDVIDLVGPRGGRLGTRRFLR